MHFVNVVYSSLSINAFISKATLFPYGVRVDFK